MERSRRNLSKHRHSKEGRKEGRKGGREGGGEGGLTFSQIQVHGIEYAEAQKEIALAWARRRKQPETRLPPSLTHLFADTGPWIECGEAQKESEQAWAQRRRRSDRQCLTGGRNRRRGGHGRCSEDEGGREGG